MDAPNFAIWTNRRDRDAGDCKGNINGRSSGCIATTLLG